MLAPNWEDHDIETNPIINYFADRQNTELILRKIEQKTKTASTVKNAKTARNFLNIETCSNNKVFGLLTNTLKSGMFLTQRGVKRTEY